MRVSTNRTTWVLRVLAFAVLAHLVVAGIDAAVLDNHAGDFDRFWDIASSAGRPYRDFAVEYPPGTFVVLKILAHASGGREVFRYVLLASNLVADAAIMAALTWGWGVEAAACFGLVSLPLFSLLGFHVDFWSVACATMAVAAWQRERLLIAMIALLGGIALKLWPLPFAVLLFMPPTGRFRLAPPVLLAVGLAGFGLFWWFLAGWAGFHDVLTFRSARGWQVESTVGSVLRLLDASSVRVESGAVRVGTLTSLVTVGLFVVAALPSVWAVERGARTRGIGSAWVAAVGALLVCSALLSPQFVGWLLPGAAIAWVQQARRLAIVTIAIAAMTAVAPPPLGVAIRNALLLVLTMTAGAAVWRAPLPVPTMRGPARRVVV